MTKYLLKSSLLRNQRGFAHHFILPVLAIAGVAIIGSVYLALSRAATIPGCPSATFAQGSVNACVGYAEVLFDGLQHAGKPSGFAIQNNGGSDGIKYGTKYYLRDDNAYGVAMFDTVKNFQSHMGISNDGVLGPQTWSDLCSQASSIAGYGNLNFSSTISYSQSAAYNGACTAHTTATPVTTATVTSGSITSFTGPSGAVQVSTLETLSWRTTSGISYCRLNDPNNANTYSTKQSANGSTQIRSGSAANVSFPYTLNCFNSQNKQLASATIRIATAAKQVTYSNCNLLVNRGLIGGVLNTAPDEVKTSCTSIGSGICTVKLPAGKDYVITAPIIVNGADTSQSSVIHGTGQTVKTPCDTLGV